MTRVKGASNYNWRNTLSDFSTAAGVLAGFSIALVSIIISTSLGNSELLTPIRWGDIAALLLGLASVCFIVAMEFDLRAKQYDLWSLPEGYRRELEREERDWNAILKDSTDEVRKQTNYGRETYNLAVYLLFAAFFFVIGPYNLTVGFVVSGIGLGFELFQRFTR